MPESTAESGQPRRKHVTTACIGCRESKIKCDAVVPVCSNCSNKGKECRYQAGEDKRKLSLRVAVELLSKRTSQLYDFIHANGLQIPPMEQDSEVSLKKIMDGLKLSHLLPSSRCSLSPASTDTHASESRSAEDMRLHSQSDRQGQFAELPSVQLPHTAPQSLGLASENEPSQGNLFPDPLYSELLVDSSFPLSNKLDHVLSDWTWNPMENMASNTHPFYTAEMVTLDNNNPSVSHPFGQPNSVIGSSPDRQTDDSSPDTEETKELIGMLSDRMGSLQIEPSGRVRFYGPTSNFNLVDMPAPDDLTVHRTIRSDGQDCLDRFGIGAAVPPDIEEHLANLYFAWQDPAIHVVTRSVYEQAKDKWQDGEDTPYFSLALMNAICALGAAFESRYHPTFITFPRSLSDFFADRAKALLDIELDSPCTATVQALVVISGHDIGCKRDARGWLYSGMALRLAFDLSLHIDLSSYVAHGALSHEEASIRQTTFWGACTADRIWSYYLGRPSHASMRTIMVPKPGATPSFEVTGEWIPYVHPQSLQDCSPVVDHVETTSRQRSLLWEIITPLSEAVYERLGVPYSGVEEIYKRVTVDLVKWKADLDESLQIDTEQDRPYLPHVLLLHMQYHQIMIYAHRPWMSRSYSQADPFLADARQQCIDSAIAIAELLRIYESQYTFRRINVQAVGMTCSAALLLIFAIVTRYQRPECKDLKVYLIVCFRALEEFGQAWENAKRNLAFLVLLQRNWESRSRMPNKNRQPSINKRSVDFTGRKRARTSSHFSDTSIHRVVPTTSIPQSQG
ncbi:fungal-specific transcription factor domain-containing protein [Hypoxylon argillaceum]|nr:fungal-specific transcription factor domain-containing protein [Hypoxylon argillaceum]